jgi:hypothetical protein
MATLDGDRGCLFSCERCGIVCGHAPEGSSIEYQRSWGVVPDILISENEQRDISKAWEQIYRKHLFGTMCTHKYDYNDLCPSCVKIVAQFIPPLGDIYKLSSDIYKLEAVCREAKRNTDNR